MKDLDLYKDYLDNGINQAMESVRQFICRMDGYVKDFEKHNDFEITNILIDNIYGEIETIKAFLDMCSYLKCIIRDIEKDI